LDGKYLQSTASTAQGTDGSNGNAGITRPAIGFSGGDSPWLKNLNLHPHLRQLEASQLVEAGKVSRLTENSFAHETMEADHRGVEIIKVDRDYLPDCNTLYAYGFNYLQCQCAYDWTRARFGQCISP